jgi:hypothetical protein
MADEICPSKDGGLNLVNGKSRGENPRWGDAITKGEKGRLSFLATQGIGARLAVVGQKFNVSTQDGLKLIERGNATLTRLSTLGNCRLKSQIYNCWSNRRL